MDGYWIGLATAAWLGVLTSISPCPLATNIAAISYIGKRVDSPRLVLASGLLYMLGRTLAYFSVALLVVGGLSSIPAASDFLQRRMNQLIGPILIVSGLLLLDIIPLPWRGSGVSDGVRERAEALGVWGALLLGLVFALAFCPVSAALFFGSLIPLALKHQSSVAMPSLYGIGTALPVAAFAVILAFFANRLSKAFNALTAAEKWMRRITAVAFFCVGVYYCLVFVFRVI